MTRGRGLTAITLLVLVASLLATASAQGAPGNLDTSFGTGGKQTTDFGGDAGATSVAVQSDGKIVVAGGADGRAPPRSPSPTPGGAAIRRAPAAVTSRPAPPTR